MADQQIELPSHDTGSAVRSIARSITNKLIAEEEAKEKAAPAGGEEPPAPSLEAVEESDEKNVAGDEGTDGDDEPEEGVVDEEGEDGSEEDEGEEGEPEKEAAPAPKKEVRIKYPSGKTYAVPPDGTLTIVVDGQPREVNIHDFASRVSGDINYHEKMEEVATRTKEAAEKERDFTTKRDQLLELNDVVVEAVKSFGEAPGLERFQSIAAIAGVDPVDFEIAVINAVAPIIDELRAKDEKGRQAWMDHRRAQFILDRDKKIQEKSKEAPAVQAARARANELIGEYKLSDAEWRGAIELLNRAKKNGELPKYGMDPNNITPDNVADVALKSRANQRVGGRLKAAFPGLEERIGQERFRGLRNSMIAAIERLDLSNEEVDELIRDAARSGATTDQKAADAARLNKKVSQNPKLRSAVKPKAKQSAPLTFKDIRGAIESL